MRIAWDGHWRSLNFAATCLWWDVWQRGPVLLPWKKTSFYFWRFVSIRNLCFTHGFCLSIDVRVEETRVWGGRGWEPRRKLFSPVEEEVEGPLPLCTTPGTMGGREESTPTQWVGHGVEVGGWRGGLLDGWRMWDSGCRAAADRQQWRRRRKRRRAGSTGEVLLTESNASFCISTSIMLAVSQEVSP